jgi:hypothetical protein
MTRWENFSAFGEFKSNEAAVKLNNMYCAFAYQRGESVNDDFFRVHTKGDGTCYFHAVLFALIGPQYSDEIGRDFRKYVSDSLTFEDWVYLQNGLVGLMLLGEKMQEFNADGAANVLEWIDKNPLRRQEALGIAYGGFLEVKRNLGDCSFYADSSFQSFVETKLGVNVLQYLPSAEKFITQKPFNSLLPTVCVHLDGAHFETMIYKKSPYVNYIVPAEVAENLTRF